MSDKLHYMGDGNKGPRGGDLYVFHCPGCKYSHPFEINCAERGWTWNGSMDKPSFTPSLLCQAHDPDFRCHSFVTDGNIQFLDDCHHDLRGQTVEIPDWDGGLK